MKDGRPQGFGRSFYPERVEVTLNSPQETVDASGLLWYIGEYKNAQFHGFGKFFQEDGRCFLGKFDKHRKVQGLESSLSGDNGERVYYKAEYEYLESGSWSQQGEPVRTPLDN